MYLIRYITPLWHHLFKVVSYLYSLFARQEIEISLFCSILSTKEQLVQTTEDKFLHLCELFRFTLLRQVVSSAYSPSIVAYNLMWKLSLQ